MFAQPAAQHMGQSEGAAKGAVPALGPPVTASRTLRVEGRSKNPPLHPVTDHFCGVLLGSASLSLVSSDDRVLTPPLKAVCSILGLLEVLPDVEPSSISWGVSSHGVQSFLLGPRGAHRTSNPRTSYSYLGLLSGPPSHSPSACSRPPLFLSPTSHPSHLSRSFFHAGLSTRLWLQNAEKIQGPPASSSYRVGLPDIMTFASSLLLSSFSFSCSKSTGTAV